MAPRLRAVLPEISVGITVAEREHETVLAVYVGQGGAGLPVTEPVTDADAELVGVRHLEVVVDTVDVARHAIEQRDQRVGIRRIRGVPGHAGGAGRAGM